MSRTTCNTAEEFYAWATKHVESGRTWTLNSRNESEEILNPITGLPIMDEPYTDYNGKVQQRAMSVDFLVYTLTATGDSSAWSRGTSVTLPLEVGNVVATSWKKNGDKSWSRFVGARKLETILNAIDKNAAAPILAAAKAAKAADVAAKAKNARNYARRNLAEAAKNFATAMRRNGADAGLTDVEETAVAADAMVAAMTTAIEA